MNLIIPRIRCVTESDNYRVHLHAAADIYNYIELCYFLKLWSLLTCRCQVSVSEFMPKDMIWIVAYVIVWAFSFEITLYFPVFELLSEAEIVYLLNDLDFDKVLHLHVGVKVNFECNYQEYHQFLWIRNIIRILLNSCSHFLILFRIMVEYVFYLSVG